MGLTVKSSFASGELDPVLHERTTLDKFKNGLATVRNWVVTKTGGIATRPSRAHFVQAKLDDSAVEVYSPPGSGLVLEWGHLYVRAYLISTGALISDVAHALLASDIPAMHFETSGSFVYVFVAGKATLKYNYATGVFVTAAVIFDRPDAPASAGVSSAGTPSGYLVEYAATYVVNGQESLPYSPLGGTSYNLPIAAGQSVGLAVTLGNISTIVGQFAGAVTEMKIYRRPVQGGVYGYIGSSSQIALSGPVLLIGLFTDLGQEADYAHNPPDLITTGQVEPGTLLSKTGVTYQQRLMITDSLLDLEAIYASQAGAPNNFARNFPLDSASALKFKCGTSGYARVLRLLDSDGLVAFTSAGIFLNQGELGPDNLAMVKKGGWVINENVPPLPVPGGVLFIDYATNSVRNLLWNLDRNAYAAEEVSIYSNHLFKTRQISTWGFQQGAFPLLWVCFSDGKYASFTFEFDQLMRAWTRHDSAPILTVRSNCGTIVPDTSFFVVSKIVGGVVRRYIECTLPRYATPSEIANDPEWQIGRSVAYMDSMKSFKTVLNDSLIAGDYFSLAVTTVDEDGNDDWSGPLNLYSQSTDIFLNPGYGTVGTVLRHFDSDGCVYDFTVTSRVDNRNVVVTPNTEVPADGLLVLPGIRLYKTWTVLTGLDHLNDENVSVVVDGGVVASPNNDIDNYPEVQVIAGSLTLPNDIRGAIIHVGRPIVGDVETLDIDTVEQAPTLVESLNVGKLYIKVHNSQGLYVGNKFPDDDKVDGMETLDSYDVDYTEEDPIIGNRAALPATKRVELTLPGDWKSQGKICVRQVDPLHAEILSIIPDSEVLTRSDR